MRWRLLFLAIIIIAGIYLYFNFQNSGGGQLFSGGQFNPAGAKTLFGSADTWFSAHFGVSLSQLLWNGLQLVLWLFEFVFKIIWSVVVWLFAAVTKK